MNALLALGTTEDGSPILVLTGAVLLGVVDDDVAGLLGALRVGELVLVVAVDVVVAGRAGGGDERPHEVHGRGGEGAAAESEEETGDDDEDVLGALLHGRGGDFRLGGGGEGLGAADLVRAEAADAEDGDDGGGEGRGVGGVRVGPGDGGEGDEERLRVAARARVGAGGGGDEGHRGDGGDEEELAVGGHGGDDAAELGGNRRGCRVRWGKGKL